MANAAMRTGLAATFDPVKREVLAGGKPFQGYKSVNDGFFANLFG